MKKVPGVKISKGEVSYTPSKTLEHLKTQKAVYASDMQRIFAGNTFITKHFQFFLNSKLGLSDTSFS